MSDQTQGHTDGLLEQHRISQERRAQVEAALRTESAAGEPPTEAPLYELSPEELAPYRLSDEERDALGAEFAGRQAGDDTAGFARYAPNQPPGEPINGYTGYAYSVHFGGFVNAPGGRTYIGVFPMYQKDASSGPYPGLR